MASVSERSIKRKLAKTSSRLVALRAELDVVDEQLRSLDDDADDWAIRAIVDENTATTREARESRAHFDAHRRQRDRIASEIDALTQRQDELLDRLAGPG